ncbi:hypothetical protein DCMF_18485 [Candidatus Formimonas warabiya]|uniref:Uncharacterized protein n=2 Tax=Formimonas warabiya TaxID=1761012 RepID=A0A3G1KVM8_FORW1|nr:hypothetical protein DCMF_18485 [Candidatus Formimonas warabiya]
MIDLAYVMFIKHDKHQNKIYMEGKIMARMFWVVCPECKKKFYVATIDFKNKKDRRMLCPFCSARFNEDEALEVIR